MLATKLQLITCHCSPTSPGGDISPRVLDSVTMPDQVNSTEPCRASGLLYSSPCSPGGIQPSPLRRLASHLLPVRQTDHPPIRQAQCGTAHPELCPDSSSSTGNVGHCRVPEIRNPPEPMLQLAGFAGHHSMRSQIFQGKPQYTGRLSAAFQGDDFLCPASRHSDYG